MLQLKCPKWHFISAIWMPNVNYRWFHDVLLNSLDGRRSMSPSFIQIFAERVPIIAWSFPSGSFHLFQFHLQLIHTVARHLELLSAVGHPNRVEMALWRCVQSVNKAVLIMSRSIPCLLVLSPLSRGNVLTISSYPHVWRSLYMSVISIPVGIRSTNGWVWTWRRPKTRAISCGT